MELRLSKRMLALAALVTPGMRLADIGTDHGYIPVYLCRAGVIPSAIAADINRGPLARAQSNISRYHLEDCIETRLSDGLAGFSAGEADAVLIAGMGGALMQRILTEGEPVLAGVQELILQPQSEIAQVRSWLRMHGFCITAEDMVKEDGKYYPMMKAQPLQTADESPDRERIRQMENAFGPLLLRQAHPVLKEWLQRELLIQEQILSKLPSHDDESEQGEKTRQRKREVCQKKAFIEDALDVFFGAGTSESERDTL